MDAEAVVNAVAIQATEYSTAAALTFLVWETCITFDDEVEFIWSARRFRWVKAAYVVLRYYTLVFILIYTITWNASICSALHLCGPNCMRWYTLEQSSLQVIIGLQQFLMASRVYALYRRSRGILWALVLPWVVEHVTILVCTVLTASTIKLFSWSCAPLSVSNVSVGIGLPPVIYDALLLGLTIRACIRAAPGTWRKTPILSLLFFDGAWAFLVVFGAFALQGIFFLVLTGPLASVAWPWQFAACSLAACRVALRMHREGGGPRDSAHVPDNDEPEHSDGFAMTTLVPEPDQNLDEWYQLQGRLSYNVDTER